MSFFEDVGIAVEECKEHDVDYRQIKRKQHDYRLASGHNEWSVKCSPDPSKEGFLPDLEWASESVISSDVAHMFGLPFEQDGRKGLWLEKHD